MYHNGSLPQQKQLLNLYLHRVDVYPEHVKIQLHKVPMSLLEPSHNGKEPRPSSEEGPEGANRENAMSAGKIMPPSSHVTDWTGEKLVEANRAGILPCQEKAGKEAANAENIDTDWLPVIRREHQDRIGESIYVGKAVLKTIWQAGRKGVASIKNCGSFNTISDPQ